MVAANIQLVVMCLVMSLVGVVFSNVGLSVLCFIAFLMGFEHQKYSGVIKSEIISAYNICYLFYICCHNV